MILAAAFHAAAQEARQAEQLYARDNLVAWCIVPFDAKKRGPEERAAMLKRLGFTKFAYDYRAEHIPTFDAEMEALKKHGIELMAWWFPGTLNDEARGILNVLKRHKLKTQLWVTGGGEPTKSPEEQAARVTAEAARIRPIAEEAAKIGCTVALYNHGGWFGDPENQLAIIEELKLPNVGIVYNQHHGHDHLARFPELVKRMLPHLVCLNLNGMVRDGERRGQKIMPLGQGELDLALLKTIQGSGYSGPIGILGHTQDDAEERLQDNLDGLEWLVKQLEPAVGNALRGVPPRPKPRTPVPAVPKDEKQGAAPAAIPKTPPEHWGRGVIGFDWKEADSVDNRWNQSDIGPFLASIVPIPIHKAPTSGRGDGAKAAPVELVAKGLSIKVGDRGQGTVCYDTKTMDLRAGWTGGFLKFDPARYGLINSPQVAGDVAFASLTGVGPKAAEFRYLGLSLHGNRVVLLAHVLGRQIRESPWLEEREGITVFTRTMEVSPNVDFMARLVGAFKGTREELHIDGGHALALVDGEQAIAFAALGDVETLGWMPAPPDAQKHVPIVEVSGGEKPRRLKLLYWSGPKALLSKFVAAVKASPPPEDLAELSKPAGPRWTEEIVTQGVLGRESNFPYVVDTLTLPFDNPYRALLFVGGHDYFANGDIAICTVHGDVWRVSGVDDKLERLVWKRFASGLFQPLGLKIVDDHVHVLGRDQITRLVDHNGDGEADEYQCFCNDYPTSTGGHDYVTCLETDSQGQFHFLHATEGLVRVPKLGKTYSVVATGFRNANGMSIGPGDEITVAPQEGEWTPGSVINEVREGGHYGYGGPRAGRGPTGQDPPLAWLPRMMDNSSGGQVWVASERWGIPRGQLLHFSYGKCRLMLVPRERVGDTVQGTVVEIPGVGFASGAMRGRFSPRDGQLYVSGLKGWASAAVDDGCLQRVRYTGKPVVLPIDRQTYANGLSITFSQPLDRVTAEDPGSYHVEQWNYRYSAGYGSPDLKVSNPAAEGHDDVQVRSATLMDEGRRVFLEIPAFRAANQTSLEYSLRTAAGQPLRQTLVATTHVVPERRMDDARLHRREPAASLVDESALAPGLLLKVSQKGSASTRAARLAAWYVPRDKPPGGALAPGSFEATASGYIKVPLRGEYQFHLTGSGAATVHLNGRKLLAGAGDLTSVAPAAATLSRGYNRLEIEYASPASGPSACRLWWTDGTFAPEPVQPTALWHDMRNEDLQADESIRRGLWLAAEHRCLNCHALPGRAGLARPDGPELEGVGARLESRWIYQWLLDPQAIRPQTHMPRMFDASKAADRQAAADIAAYLGSMVAPGSAGASPSPASPSPASPSQSSPPELTATGAAMFEDLGCVACHRLTPVADEDRYDRLPLAHVASKFRPGELARFLRQPREHHARTRMPDFALLAPEAAALADHLGQSQPVIPKDDAEFAKADAARGKTLFREHRCHACHAVSRHEIEPDSNQAIPIHSTSGCLAPDAKPGGKHPIFSLSAQETRELAALYSRSPVSVLALTPVEQLPLAMASLRCGACHHRDHQAAPLRRIVAEESDHGVAPEGIPNLTWAGEKLHTDWTAKLLAGQLPVRSRPWLKARMPAFHADAQWLAEALAAEHGVPLSHSPPRETDVASELAGLGDRLTRKDGGLDCRSCHAVDKDQPTGDERTKVAQGINFALTRARLRDDFYLRFVLDPPRHDVTTRMPKLSADGRATGVTSILDGDARRQFEAIWHFIQTVGN